MHSYVLLLLFNNQNEVLLFRRINASFGNNEYSLIGGKIEANETARQALVREAAEEIGITINPDNLTLLHTLHRKGSGYNFFALFFSASEWQGQPINKEPQKHADLGWFAIDALPKNTLSAHHQVIELVRQDIRYSEHGW